MIQKKEDFKTEEFLSKLINTLIIKTDGPMGYNRYKIL